MVTQHPVLIVDDEPLARQELAAILNSQHLDFEVAGSVDSTAKAWTLIQQQPNIEGIFLDIDIETESKRAGLDFALNLSRLSVKPWIVFVSGYQEYAIEAYQAFPVNYLLKPIDNAALERVLNWVRVRNHRPGQPIPPQNSAKRLAIRHRINNSEGEKITCTEYIDPDEILYIQKNNSVNTVRIGLIKGEILDGINSTLAEWKADGFFQIHRRNLVNLKHIRREMPRIGENNVYKIAFKGCPVELDVGPEYLLTLHEALKKQ